jgi:peptidyl-prolyl cis-trans isomerase-like 4
VRQPIFIALILTYIQMSVLLETTLGDIVIDLETRRVPENSRNFIQLAELKRFNNLKISSIDENFICIFGDSNNDPGNAQFQYRHSKTKFCPSEHHEKVRHSRMGTVGTVSGGESFYITLRDGPLPHLDQGDRRLTIVGYIEEGLEVVEKINSAICDSNKKPFNPIRIRHAVVLDNPDSNNPPNWYPSELPNSPIEIVDEELRPIDDFEDERVVAEREKEAVARAQQVELELMGDLPSADIRPPNNVLFVCQLNPVTEDEDLETVFSRFGEIKKCEVIRDYKTGDSLQYAFIEFVEESACNKAYVAMQNVLIDDKRIKVDFSQSVSKIWNHYRRDGKMNNRSTKRDRSPRDRYRR